MNTSNMDVTASQFKASWNFDIENDNEQEDAWRELEALLARGSAVGIHALSAQGKSKVQRIVREDAKNDAQAGEMDEAEDEFVIEGQVYLADKTRRELKQCIGGVTNAKQTSAIAEVLVSMVQTRSPELLDQIEAAGLALDMQRKEALQAAESQLNNVVRAFQKKIKSNSNQIAKLQALILSRDESAEQQDRIEELETVLQRANDDISGLKKQKSAVESSLETMRTLKEGAGIRADAAETIKALELKNKDRELEDKERVLGNRDRELERLQAEKTNLLQRLRDTSTELRDTKASREFVSIDRDSEKDWRKQTQEENSELKEKLRKSLEAGQVASSALSDTRETIADLDAQNKKLVKAASTFAKQEQDLQTRLEKATTELTNQRQRADEHKATINTMVQEEVKQGHEKIRREAELRSQISDLKESNKVALEKAKADARAELETSNEKVLDLERKLHYTADLKTTAQLELVETKGALNALTEQQKSKDTSAEEERLKEYQSSRDEALRQRNLWASIVLRCVLADPDWYANMAIIDPAVPLKYVQAWSGAGKIVNKAYGWLEDFVGLEVVIKTPQRAETTAVACWYDSNRGPNTLNHRDLHAVVSSLVTQPEAIPVVLGFLEAALEQQAKFEDRWSRENALFAIRGLELICRFHHKANYPGLGRLRKIYDMFQPQVEQACEKSRLVCGFNAWVGDLVNGVSSSLTDEMLTKVGDEVCVFKIDEATRLIGDGKSMIVLQKDGPTRYCSPDDWKLRFDGAKGWEVTLLESGQEIPPGIHDARDDLNPLTLAKDDKDVVLDTARSDVQIQEKISSLQSDHTAQKVMSERNSE